MEAGIAPTTRVKYPPEIGLTCAACHTGQLEDNKISLRIDGGPAMTDLGRLEETVVDMGTDPEQSKILAHRKVALPPAVGFGSVKIPSEQKDCDLSGRSELNTVFGVALMAAVGRAVDKWFADNPTDAAIEKAMRGPRPNCPNERTFTPPCKVVPHSWARPHDGAGPLRPTSTTARY